MKISLFAMALLVPILSCAEPSYSPDVYKRSQTIKVISSLKDAEGIKYVLIQEISARQGFRGPILNQAPISVNAAISAAKIKAASLGADAIIILECKEIGMTWGSMNDLECKALAVKLQ